MKNNLPSAIRDEPIDPSTISDAGLNARIEKMLDSETHFDAILADILREDDDGPLRLDPGDNYRGILDDCYEQQQRGELIMSRAFTVETVLISARQSVDELRDKIREAKRSFVPACAINQMERELAVVQGEIDRLFGPNDCDHYDAAAERHDTSAD